MTEPIEQLRAMVATTPPEPRELAAYLEKVRSRAYGVTNRDVEALIAGGVSEDELFQHTAAVAVVEGLRRLDAGLGAIG